MTDERIFHLPMTLKEANGESGFVAGFGSTPDIDGIDDKVLPTAFENSVKTLTEKNRKLPMRYQHKEPIGIFHTLKVVDDGLFVEGQINKDVQRGREVLSLAKQGAIAGMSIGGRIRTGGYAVEDGKEIYIIKDFDLREITLTDTPMNTEAEITQIKEMFAELKSGFKKDRPDNLDTEKSYWDKVMAGYNAAKEAETESQKSWFAGVMKSYNEAKQSSIVH